jgi:UDP-N-acetylmuramate-alanine ligase
LVPGCRKRAAGKDLCFRVDCRKSACRGALSININDSGELDIPGSFLKLSPTIVVVTNVDDDHLDHYGNMENLKEAWQKGTVLMKGDDPVLIIYLDVTLMQHHYNITVQQEGYI